MQNLNFGRYSMQKGDKFTGERVTVEVESINASVILKITESEAASPLVQALIKALLDKRVGDAFRYDVGAIGVERAMERLRGNEAAVQVTRREFT